MMSSLLLGVVLGLGFFAGLAWSVSRGRQTFVFRAALLLLALALAGRAGLALPLVAAGILAGRQLVFEGVKRWS